ncbi:FlgD immunoglobulin-like domain containing protein, partial [Shimia abyssi]
NIERAKVDDFYAARDGTTPTLPWTSIAPPFTIADQADLVVLDANGIEVQRYAIGVEAEELSWQGTTDAGGTFPDGLYEFQVESFANGQSLGIAQAHVYTHVNEVQSSPYGTSLIGPGGVEVLSSHVISLRTPE